MTADPSGDGSNAPTVREILMVDDSRADVRLAREALKDARHPHRLHVVSNGVDALRFLRREDEFSTAPRPDLVVLDLNLPIKSGRQVLGEIRDDPHLCRLPVIVLSTSDSIDDVRDMYSLAANCYVTKPMDIAEFRRVLREIETFWIGVARLPD